MPETIMIIEDDPFNRDILREIIEAFPTYEVVEASNGRDALDWLQCNPPPALILLDMMMPRMDGYTLLQEMHTDPRLRDIRVLGISARARAGDEQKALAAGCWRYLTKPFDIAEVETTVEAALARRV